MRTLGSLLVLFALLAAAAPGAAAPEGQVTSLQAVSIATRWFDRAEAEGIITPFIFYYALHDAVVKPMPGKPLAPSLAESWSVSPDGLNYEFVLRRGVRFHNGDLMSAEDVKFSFERYRGAAASTYRARVAAVEVVDPDPSRARRLLAEAGYPSGFDAGTISADLSFTTTAEAVVNYLRAVGIRATLRPLERAAFFKDYQDKRIRHILLAASAAFGNAATRLEAFVASTGTYTYGTYPDIEGLIREQATELDPRRREAILQKIQQLMHERAMFAPIMEPAILYGVGPRVAESALGLITNMAGSAPYEDIKLKGQ
jgi:ABC-type transport system substrate-binding protein